MPESPPNLTVRPGHPDFLDLSWHIPISDWQHPDLLDLPKEISRHEVRFIEYPQGVYVIKELPSEAAAREYAVLRQLELAVAPAVTAIGLIQSRHPDPGAEASAALITRYVEYSFSYRQLTAGPGFGPRRNQMLDAIAGLLVQLHLAGCFWGDCSLSNVLYRFDAENIETLMVDAETAFLQQALSDGQRNEDLDIMIENVAGGMADIAAQAGAELDDADLQLGEDIAARYRALWNELTSVETIGPDERYRIGDRLSRINSLGFDVEEVDLVSSGSGSRLKVKFKVAGRNYHNNRLKSLTGVDALEFQARQILTDLYYYQARVGSTSPSGKGVTAIRWRAAVFEPMLARLRETEGVVDPLQGYCDLLHHRYVLSVAAGRDIGTEAALADWIKLGRPGYPLA